MSNLKKILERFPDVLDFEEVEDGVKPRRKKSEFKDLEDIVGTYLEKETSDVFRLNPQKAFEFGRKVQRSFGPTLEEIEEMVNLILPQKMIEFQGPIRVKLCDDLFDSYIGYFFSGLYYDIMRESDSVTFDFRRNMPKFPHLRYRIENKWGFGYKHRRGELILLGYPGGYIGEEMSGGKIEVIGSTGDRVGYRMRGGEIIVRGSCGWRIGDEMSGGKIVIEGDVGEWLGINMSGGEIRVRRNIGSFGKRFGGKVLVWKDGWVEV